MRISRKPVQTPDTRVLKHDATSHRRSGKAPGLSENLDWLVNRDESVREHRTQRQNSRDPRSVELPQEVDPALGGWDAPTWLNPAE